MPYHTIIIPSYHNIIINSYHTVIMPLYHTIIPYYHTVPLNYDHRHYYSQFVIGIHLTSYCGQVSHAQVLFLSLSLCSHFHFPLVFQRRKNDRKRGEKREEEEKKGGRGSLTRLLYPGCTRPLHERCRIEPVGRTRYTNGVRSCPFFSRVCFLFRLFFFFQFLWLFCIYHSFSASFLCMCLWAIDVWRMMDRKIC